MKELAKRKMPRPYGACAFARRRTRFWFLLLLAELWALTLRAITPEVLHTFGATPSPSSALVEGSDGAFYGTTYGGGDHGCGMIFRMRPPGEFAVVASFNFTNGANPDAGLIVGPGGDFYGTTENGGSFQSGTVFRLTTAGELTTLISFSKINGANPFAALAWGQDGALYGTTARGGECDLGTVFRLSTNGVLKTLLHFNGTNGAGPLGELVQGNDGAFYGTTAGGGSSITNDWGGNGTVFRITTNGVLTTLVSFGGDILGVLPYAGLVQGIDGAFYGTTSFLREEPGLLWGGGTVFRITPDGTFTTLRKFDLDAMSPYASLALGADGQLYGSSWEGGRSGAGALFRMTTNGDMTILASFHRTDGAHPRAAMFQGTDGAFYGTTSEGGDDNVGTVFQMTTNGALTMLVSFENTAPASPYGALAWGLDRELYGVTRAGGEDNLGTVFRLGTNGVAKTLASFTLTNGAFPNGSLLLTADGSLYGTTSYGGSGSDFLNSGYGTVFRITGDGQMRTLMSFGLANGAYPDGGLVQGKDGNFYGTTVGGGKGQIQAGTFFRMTADGEVTVLAEFDGTNACQPVGTLVEAADGAFYGTTRSGGGSSMFDGPGSVFRATTNGQLTMIATFGGMNGTWPASGLVAGSEGALYGTTSKGGTANQGTVFCVTTNGELITLVSFDGVNGSYPSSALVRGGPGVFYGTTDSGGLHGLGTVFRVTTNGLLTTLTSFNSANGGHPRGSVLLGSDGALYGTCQDGGYQGGGTVFRLSLSSRLLPLAPAANGWLISFDGIPSDVYWLERADNLSGPWQTLSPVVADSDGFGLYLDASPPPEQAFYRLIAQ